MRKLSKGMTLRQFDHGYRYATEVKTFAQALGVRAAHALRKDELVDAPKNYTALTRIRGTKPVASRQRS